MAEDGEPAPEQVRKTTRARADVERHRRIVLNYKQTDLTVKDEEIGKVAGVSKKQVSKIVAAARASKVILYERAVLDPSEFGLNELYFVQIRLHRPDPVKMPEDAARLQQLFRNIQEIHHTIAIEFEGANKTAYHLLIKIRCRTNRDMQRFVQFLRADKNNEDILVMMAPDTFQETMEIDLDIKV
jgi:DNA-binding Lrp family transcriptional regulator